MSNLALKREVETDKLISYWYRIECNNSIYDFPSELSQLINKYRTYPIVYFDLYPNDTLIITHNSNDNTSLIKSNPKNSNGNYISMAASQFPFDKNISSYFEYNIKIIKTGSSSYIGLCTKPKRALDANISLQRDSGFGISYTYMSTGSIFKCVSNNIATEINDSYINGISKSQRSFTVNDIISIEINFTLNELLFYKNKELMSKVININNNLIYYPSMCFVFANNDYRYLCCTRDYI